MTFPQLLMILAERGLHVRRIASDKLECIGGDLDVDLQQTLATYRDDFLRLLPDPSQDAQRLWQQMLDDVNGECPELWFGTEEQWSILDRIEQQYLAAKESGEIEAVRSACDKYRQQATSFFLIDDALAWAES